MKTDVLHPGQGPTVWLAGDRYTVLTNGQDTNGAFALVHAVVPPGGGPPPHRHTREDEAFYVLAGDVTVHADGRTFTASHGTWVTLARGSLHWFRNDGKDTATMLVLVTPAGLEQYFLEAGQPVVDPSEQPPPPDVDKMLALAPKYGLEILPPGD
jgi:quercetin dioxygenase-like cupin family protein